MMAWFPSPLKPSYSIARCIAGPKSDVANDDVIGAELHLVVADADAVAGRGLPGDRDIRVLDFYLRLEGNRA